MRKLQAAFGAALLVTSGLLVRDASATPLAGALPGEMGGNCAYKQAEVQRWTPAAGPAASAIADAYLTHGGSLWMALGHDDTGFWSVQGAFNDACDDCGSLYLVHTDFTGKQTLELVADEELRRKHEQPAALRKAIKARLFTLATRKWRPDKLSQDYKLELPKHDAEGKIESFTGWMAQVSRKDGFLLRFAPTATTTMCWCDYSWTAYTLAKPKPKPKPQP